MGKSHVGSLVKHNPTDRGDVSPRLFPALPSGDLTGSHISPVLPADNFVVPVCNDSVVVLYQDDDILLINKPSGLLCLSGKNPLNRDSVHYRLVNGQEGKTPAFPEAKLPHRLDFGTSGIMLAGLNAASVQHLNKQFEARSIKKRYVALLEGWIADDKGWVTAPIAKDKNHFPRVRICDITGKSAISEYTVLQRLEQPRRSLVQFTLHTGRTHQLRIHSQALGHPILGCDLYKSDYSETMSDRLLLHASDLYFEHPGSGEQRHAQCPCPF
jgi:tRNA pseudouridine32 synthase/23S rRNA pseudouridine746 synthase